MDIMLRLFTATEGIFAGRFDVECNGKKLEAGSREHGVTFESLAIAPLLFVVAWLGRLAVGWDLH